MMRNILILLFIPLACTYQYEEHEWFVDNWVSDTEATIDLNRARGVSEEILQAFRPMYGKIRWEVMGRTLTFVNIDGKKFSYTIEIETSGRNKFTLITDHADTVIEKTSAGFCALPNENVPAYPDGGIQMNGECFKRVGT